MWGTTHRAKADEVTPVVADIDDVQGEEPADHGVLEVNRLGRVSGIRLQAGSAGTCIVATEVFLYRPDVLVEVLEALHRQESDEPDEGDDGVGDSGLGDFGDLLLPRFVDRGQGLCPSARGYWRDLGQPHHYLNAHLELVDLEGRPVRRRLADPDEQPQREPTYVATGRPARGQPAPPGLRRGPGRWSSACSVRASWWSRAPRWWRACCSGGGERSGRRVTRAIVDAAVSCWTALTWEGRVALDDPDAIPIVGQDSTVG